MSQPGDTPAAPTSTSPPPTLVTAPVAPVTPVAPVAHVDDSAARAQLEDLQLQEEVVAQILAVLDETGRAVADGAPAWVDPDVFGSSRDGMRMARHTIRAQVRVQQALDLASSAMAQHHVALQTFRDEVHRVEASTTDQLAAVRARVEGTSA